MKKLFFFFTLVVTGSMQLLAQQFPVQVTPQLMPPYTTQVSEYYSPSLGNAKINLLLLNRDFNKPVLYVRLRMSIESQGVRITTREDNPAIFTPIAINSGQPYYVSPEQLAQYFNINNINLSGMSPTEYTTIGKLPEGFYTFCFEAVEVSTNQAVSNKGCTFGWMNLNDPPMLNLPTRGESVIPSSTAATQNILFTWTPRHTASPGAAFTTLYIFTIAEITDNTVAPEAAFLSSTPLYTDSTTTTTYLYDGTKQALIPGKKYAWRVQAKTKDGIVEVANFKNNGFSEIFWFNYKNSCPLVTGIDDAVTGVRATISWLANPQYLDYKIIYRETGNSHAEWFDRTVTGTQVMLADLKDSTTYEYRVGAACDQGVYTFSATYTFSTLDSATSMVPNCGEDPNLTNPPAGTPLAALVPGDVIHAGDFTVTVTKASGSNGNFSGEGYVTVSYLAGMKLAVVFNGIGVNSDHKLTSGQIQTTYDPTEGGIESVDDYIDYYTAGYGVGGVVSGAASADTTIGFTIGSISVTLPNNYNSTTGTVDGGGTIPIVITPVAGGGDPITYNVEKLPVTIMDKDGNVYQVDKTGVVTQIGNAGGKDLISKMNPTQIDDNKAIVKFIPLSTAVYAFDEWKEVYKKSNAFNKEYERIRTETNGDYYVSAKAIAPGATDQLKAKVTITDNSIIPDSIKFVNGKGVIYKSVITKSTDTTFIIDIVGGPEKDAQEIYAVYKQDNAKNLNLGKVLVASYPRREYNVKLIPVGTNTLADLNSAIAQVNGIYNKINVNASIELANSFNSTSWDTDGDGLDVKGSSALSVYTSEMAAIISGYKQSNPVDPNTFYVFILNHAADSVVLGDMPRGKQFGFLFTEGNTDPGTILSHEIAHGIFKLKHIFDYNDDFRSEITGNLLNYPAGNSLTKTQWDLIQDPASIILSFFENDDDGLYVSVDNAALPASFKNPGSESYSFYGPTGKIYTLPSDIKSVQFSTGELYYVNGNANYLFHPEQIAMVGSLVSFVDKNGVKWSHTTSSTWPTIQNKDFRKQGDTLYVENPAFANIVKKPVIGRPCFKEGKAVFQIVNVLNTSDINVNNGFTWAEIPALTNYFLNNLSRCIYVKLNIPDVDDAINYIYSNKESASYDKEYATYIFGLTDLFNEMPEIQLCATASDEGFKAYETSLSEITNESERKELLKEYYYKYFSLYFEFYKNKNKDPEFYFNQVCQAFTIPALCKATRVNSLSEFPCLLETVSWNTRKDLLELFSGYGNSSTNNAIGILIKTTPVEQESRLLDFLAQNNYYQLFHIYDALDEYNQEIVISALVTILNENFKVQRSFIEQHKVDPLTLSESERTSTYNLPLWKTNSIVDCDSWLNGVLNGPISAVPLANICEGFSSKKYQTSNLLVHLYKKLDGTLYVSPSSESDPFGGFVNLHFKDDFNYAGIKAGTVMTVPSIYAYHFAKRHTSQLNSQATRIALNTAAILGAVFTGGGSLTFLGVSSVALSATDIYIAIREDDLRGTEGGRAFLDYYNKFTAALALIQITGAIPATGKLIIRITPDKFRAVSRQAYQKVLDNAVDFIASAKKGVATFTSLENFNKLRDLVTAQMLRVKVIAECRKIGPNVFNSNFENLYLKTNRLNTPSHIAEYRILDNAQVLDFSSGGAKLVEDKAIIDDIIHSSEYEKVGAIDNTAYLKRDGTATSSSLDIYQSKNSPDKLIVVERTAAGISSSLQNFENLNLWVNSLDEVADGALISKIGQLDVSDLTKLEADIASSSHGSTVKDLLRENPDDLTDIWKKLKDDPKYSFELSKTGGNRWEKWGQSNFFKTITKAGKDFEVFALSELRTAGSVLRNKLSTKYNIDITQYEVFEQVQIKTGKIIDDVEEYFVADFVLVKKQTIGGQDILDFQNSIVLETKLSFNTALTVPQTSAVAKVKTTSNVFNVRSVERFGAFTESNVLTNVNQVKVTDYIKVYSDGVGQSVLDIISLK